MKSSAAARNSSSTVSMRLRVSGPVSSILPSAVELDHAARPEAFAELRTLGIVRILRLFFGVQVVEIAEELVEAVVGGQELVLVAQVVLAELSGGVPQRLEEFRDARIFRPQANVGPGQADFRQPGADGRLPGDERRAPGGAALLPVPVGEPRAFLGNPVDIRRLVPHDALVIGTRVEPANVVAHDDEDVGFLLLRLRLGETNRGEREHQGDGTQEAHPAT